MGKALLLTTVGFLVVYSLTVLLTGNPRFLIVTGILALLVGTYAAVQWMLQRRIAARHGSLEDAMSARDEDIPSAHLVPDERPVGDTAEAHDELSPHDLPVDAPGRHEAERQASDTGFTGGDADPAEAGRFERGTGSGGEVPEGEHPEEPSDEPATRPGGVTRPIV